MDRQLCQMRMRLISDKYNLATFIFPAKGERKYAVGFLKSFIFVDVFSVRPKKMHPMKFFLPFCLLAIWLFAACQPNQNATTEETLFEEYYIRFLEPEKELMAYATFQEGDSLESAKAKIFFGGVSFQGSGMQVRNLPKGIVRYTYKLKSANYQPPFKFRYKNDLGEQVEEIVQMQGIGKFEVTDSISQRKGMNLIIENGNLSENEQFILLFTDQTKRAFSIPIMGPTARNNYRLQASQISKLSKGKGQLYLVKKQNITREEGNRSISCNIEYYSNTIDIEVFD